MYRKLIIEFTNCTPNEAPAVELCMRDQYGTLDDLGRAEFRTVARKALVTVRQNPDLFKTWRL